MAESDSTFLQNIWYHAASADTLKPGTMQAVKICGDPIVLARGDDGVAYALRDICPHRGIPLSCGRMVAGKVECGYHGWQFNHQGKCQLIPSLVPGQEIDVQRIQVKRYPLLERAGQLFIWLGDAPADESLLPQLPTRSLPTMTETSLFPCFIDHAVIGLMDPAHGPFVHRSWWWRSGGSIHEKAKAFGPVSHGFAMLKHRPSKNSNAYKILGGVPETEIRFHLPGMRIEHIVAGSKEIVNLTCVTPIDANTSKITNSFYWNMPVLSLLRPVLRRFARSFLDQDRRVVVNQQQGLRYNPPLMLIRDADTMARWYYQLKEEYQRSQTEQRPFKNPVPETVLKWRS